MESIDLYVLLENVECERISSEHSLPFSQRPVDNRFFGIPFKLLPQATKMFFFRHIQRRDTF
jgi:hypothetical protein